MVLPFIGHNFRKTSAAAVADKVVGAAVSKTVDILFSSRAAAVAGYPGFEELRDWGRSRKMEVSGISPPMGGFAERLEAAGGVAHFARNGREAVEIVAAIAQRLGAVSAVKSKSMTAEEISLNEALPGVGVTVTETDLGEFIIQLAGEKPSHIVAPAIHKNRAQVAELFHDASGAPPAWTFTTLFAWPEKRSGSVSLERTSELPARISPSPRPDRSPS